jgi:hypothetical protein
LRTWYRHDPALFDEFVRRYRDELTESGRAGALAHLQQLATKQMLTLLTATKDVDISEAAVLADLIAPSTGEYSPLDQEGMPAIVFGRVSDRGSATQSALWGAGSGPDRRR